MNNLKLALLAASRGDFPTDAAKTDILEAVASLPPVHPALALASVVTGFRLVSRMLGFRLKKRSYLYMTNKYWRKSSRKLAKRSRSDF